jgi:hypothetical protein
MAQQTPHFIVASPRPRVGKTLLARLLIEYLHASGRPVTGYDLNPREPALAGRFPELVSIVDIAETLGQMELFDRLIAPNPRPTVIDLGYRPFDQFFAVMAEIDFVREARRRGVEPIVLFVTDPAPATVNVYADLREDLPGVTFVPVHNEAASLSYSKEDFPPSRAQLSALRMPRLSAIVRGVVDRASFSFTRYVNERLGGPTEIHSWVADMFAEFRELELRLIMSKLSLSFGGHPPVPPRETRRAG